MQHSNTRHSMRRYQQSIRRHQRSVQQYLRSCGVSSNIGDCGVGITPQMCNRVTNHGDMSTFSNPVWNVTGMIIFENLNETRTKTNFPIGRSGKYTHISMISNSVTHLQSYTNTAITDIAGDSATRADVSASNPDCPIQLSPTEE